MMTFIILQIAFDAFFVFGFLFLFHYTVHRMKVKQEENEMLQELRIQEIKEDLQELLVTMKQVGSESAEQVEKRVQEAAQHMEHWESLLAKIKHEAALCERLAEDLQAEREQLSMQLKMTRAARSAQKKKKKKEAASAFPALEQREEKKGNVLGLPQGAVEEVYRMADESKDVAEIARKMQLTRGEVQLILNLRGNRFTLSN